MRRLQGNQKWKFSGLREIPPLAQSLLSVVFSLCPGDPVLVMSYLPKDAKKFRGHFVMFLSGDVFEKC